MLKRIQIDTNNGNYYKYPYNEKLWNIIVPNIKFIQETSEMYPGKDVDWVSYKKELEHSNGHCVYIDGNRGYIAAYEFEYLWFEEDFLKKYAYENASYLPGTWLPYSLSDLLKEISRIEKIDWKIIETEEEIKERENTPPPSFDGIISVFNSFKLMRTPLQSMTELKKDK